MDFFGRYLGIVNKYRLGSLNISKYCVPYIQFRWHLHWLVATCRTSRTPRTRRTTTVRTSSCWPSARGWRWRGWCGCPGCRCPASPATWTPGTSASSTTPPATAGTGRSSQSGHNTAHLPYCLTLTFNKICALILLSNASYLLIYTISNCADDDTNTCIKDGSLYLFNHIVASIPWITLRVSTVVSRRVTAAGRC